MTERERAPCAGAAGGVRRKHRSRPMPKWLESSAQLDAIARSRCLMVLSVLSGEKPVTEAIGEARISRGTYYQMETRALKAMLAALNPLASSPENAQAELLGAARARIEQLEDQVGRLEQERRRSQRLLLLTRKTMLRTPVTTGRRGRMPKAVLPGSSPSGKARSENSKAKASASPSSTPTRAGASGGP